MNNPVQLQVGVKALITNDSNEILFLKRNSEMYPEVGDKWDIPGGRIKLGISLVENLKREILEETSLSMTTEPRLIGAQDILKPDFHVVRLTYLVKASGEVKLDGKEHNSFKWVSLADAKKLQNMDIYVIDILQTLAF